MNSALKLLLGFGLLVPGLLLLLRVLHLAPAGLESITSFFFGSARPFFPLPFGMTVAGAVLVFSALTSGPPSIDQRR
ncbi:MAG: hypothetical protein IAE78_00500 [Myxococcus sp.]|nr:hypothetical protein [Myxococcus sp.]